jgi:hypothetical protein
MDAFANAIAPSLQGAALAGGMTAAEVFGWGKLTLDGAIFVGSMAFCVAQ